MEKKRYYSLTRQGATAQIDIYGDITSWPWLESDVSSHNLAKQLAELDGVTEIFVNINSYGGEVAEGLAIYNALKRHPARVVTRCDGFACSIASVIFMAGDERIMNAASLLMVHNAWSNATGNAADLRKQADDLDTITGCSKAAYMSHVNITEDELTALMDAETFIEPADAVEMGFATSVEDADPANVSQSARSVVMGRVLMSAARQDGAADPEGEPEEPADEPGREPDGEPDDEDDDTEPKTASERLSALLQALDF